MQLGDFTVGLDCPLFLIAGPCAIESEALAYETAGALQAITAELGMPFIYKSSFDKANRSSHHSRRGVGLAAVQIAKARGAEAWGTASASKHAWLRELGVDHFLEIGPGRVLSGLIARIARRTGRAGLSSAGDLDEAVEFVKQSAA